ncbi:MAG: adenosylcobalamin-dependent ribonucleoside-diphosphate reductase [Phycisphaerae bacterium]|nr:adenosylcobalamin-dependent ribonucleoside-diphosphate reductase [Phycisphaerae bacterium]
MAMEKVPAEIELTLNARRVLENRYLKKDASGSPIESPEDMFHRVAQNIAQAEEALGGDRAAVGEAEETFYGMMARLEFMPNSPTLMNAGRTLQQLAACFVLPVPDSIDLIFDAIKYAAIIHKSGGGTGFSFSRIRPAGDLVSSSRGAASGPISFMKVFNYATEAINQGGFRRGANMGILRVDHPDVLDFIRAKVEEGELVNFNISVAITDEFMKALETGGEYSLRNPHTGRAVRSLRAEEVFSEIARVAHKTGDPGAIFLGPINRGNPTPRLGDIESTNPCGEQPLLPFEACVLGSINLAKVVADGEIDLERLGRLVEAGVHFLDNAIEASRFPLAQITEVVRSNRKIGLGIMGWADVLIALGIPYDSPEALDLADKISGFIRHEADKASARLAEVRGPFSSFAGSIYDRPGAPLLRNATRVTIAPTGSISIIAGCSSGIEPLFALCFERHVLGGQTLREINAVFEKTARQRGFWSDDLMERITHAESIKDVEDVPEDVQRVFTTALEIPPEFHVRMQASWQKHIDNAVSKTVNLPFNATQEDVAGIYRLAYGLGCKGITVYRNESREKQVLVKRAAAGEPEDIEPAPGSCNRPDACFIQG